MYIQSGTRNTSCGDHLAPEGKWCPTLRFIATPHLGRGTLVAYISGLSLQFPLNTPHLRDEMAANPAFHYYFPPETRNTGCVDQRPVAAVSAQYSASEE